MKHSIARLASFGMLIALMCGCASYPMGLSRSEWEGLPPTKQAELAKKQNDDDASTKKQAANHRSLFGSWRLAPNSTSRQSSGTALQPTSSSNEASKVSSESGPNE